MKGNLNQNLKENFGLNSPLSSAFRGLHLTPVLCLQLAVIDMHGRAERLEHVLSPCAVRMGGPGEHDSPVPWPLDSTPHTHFFRTRK